MLQKLSKFIALFTLSYLISSCKQAPAPELERSKGLLRIATIPTDMPIIVNGQPKGNSASGAGQYFSISLEEGDHKIEILKPVDDEKEQYAEKIIFIAADTLPIITLEAQERLTTFGEKEKARREAEDAENARVAEIERRKSEELATERKRLKDIETKRLNAVEEARLKKIRAPYQKEIGKYIKYHQTRDINGTDYIGYYIGKISGFSGEQFQIDIKTANCEWVPRYPCNIEIDAEECTSNIDIKMYKKKRPAQITIPTSCISSKKMSFLTNQEVVEAESKGWYSRF